MYPYKFMISENRRLEFWNFLIAEKNQPRPKGITTQRLAVIRPAILSLDDLWLKIVDPRKDGEQSAADFYGTNEPGANDSRTEFWNAVRSFIRQSETQKNEQHQPSKPKRGSRNKSISRHRKR